MSEPTDQSPRSDDQAQSQQQYGPGSYGQQPPAQGNPSGSQYGAPQQIPQQYGAPQYGAPQQTSPQYGAPQSGAPQYGAPQYGAPQSGAPQYGAPQQLPQQYGAPQYGAPQYGAPQYGAPQYGAPQQSAYGAPAVQKPTGWFVVNWLFFWPLAIYSLVSAWGKIDEARFAGDIAGANFQASRVKKFGIIGLCVGLGLTLFWIIIAIAIGATAAHCTDINGYAQSC